MPLYPTICTANPALPAPASAAALGPASKPPQPPSRPHLSPFAVPTVRSNGADCTLSSCASPASSSSAACTHCRYKGQPDEDGALTPLTDFGSRCGPYPGDDEASHMDSGSPVCSNKPAYANVHEPRNHCGEQEDEGHDFEQDTELDDAENEAEDEAEEEGHNQYSDGDCDCDGSSDEGHDECSDGGDNEDGGVEAGSHSHPPTGYLSMAELLNSPEDVDMADSTSEGGDLDGDLGWSALYPPALPTGPAAAPSFEPLPYMEPPTVSLGAFLQANHVNAEHSGFVDSPFYAPYAPSAGGAMSATSLDDTDDEAFGDPNGGAGGIESDMLDALSLLSLPHPHTATTLLFSDGFLTSNQLAPMNGGLDVFLLRWVRAAGWKRSSDKPCSRKSTVFDRAGPFNDKVRAQLRPGAAPSRVERKDLQGDRFDVQGIDWEDMGVSRRQAREHRLAKYENFVNTKGADEMARSSNPYLPVLPNNDSFFRFKRMDLRRDTHLAHFQLRNLLACASPTQVFYAGKGVVRRFNPVTGQSSVALGNPDGAEAAISTMDAAHGVLVSGNFNGEYVTRPLQDEHGDNGRRRGCGLLTTSPSAITNHVQVEVPRRASGPHACFASNDCGLRLLDVAADRFVWQLTFQYPINCTAASPDGQLRVMVGDQQKVLVVPADGSNRAVAVAAPSPGTADSFAADVPDITMRIDIEHELPAHQDHGFACAWADDGWTVATGFQDRVVAVWDARNWGAGPLTKFRTEMAGARSLRFSPAGSGHRVLVAAEEADFVNIIDARTFESKQTFDFFSEIGGVAFEPQGHDLFVLCPDNARGGIIQLERCLDVGALEAELDQYRFGFGSGASGSLHRPDSGHGGYPSRGHETAFDFFSYPPSTRPPDEVMSMRLSKYYSTSAAPDWPSENMSLAKWRTRRALARRRQREAALAVPPF